MKINALLLPENTQLIETLTIQHDLKNVRIHPPVVDNEKQSINLLVDLKDEKTDLNQVGFLQFELSKQLGHLVRVKTSIHYPLHDYEKRQSKAVSIIEYDKVQDLFKQDNYELEKWQNPMPPKIEHSIFEHSTFKAPIEYPPIPLPPAFPSFFSGNKRPSNAINEPVFTVYNKDKEENRIKRAKLVEIIINNVKELELDDLLQIQEEIDKIQQIKLANCKPNEFGNSNRWLDINGQVFIDKKL